MSDSYANKTEKIGRLVADPRISTLPGTDREVCNFRILVVRYYKKDGDPKWYSRIEGGFNVAKFGSEARDVYERYGKGDLVRVQGRDHQKLRELKNRDGSPVTWANGKAVKVDSYYISAWSVELVRKKGDRRDGGQQAEGGTQASGAEPAPTQSAPPPSAPTSATPAPQPDNSSAGDGGASASSEAPTAQAGAASPEGSEPAAQQSGTGSSGGDEPPAQSPVDAGPVGEDPPAASQSESTPVGGDGAASPQGDTPPAGGDEPVVSQFDDADVPATPGARELAAELRVDLRTVTPTGLKKKGESQQQVTQKDVKEKAKANETSSTGGSQESGEVPPEPTAPASTEAPEGAGPGSEEPEGSEQPATQTPAGGEPGSQSQTGEEPVSRPQADEGEPATQTPAGEEPEAEGPFGEEDFVEDDDALLRAFEEASEQDLAEGAGGFFGGGAGDDE
jgi:single-stranded DNA-binding protein